MHRPKAITNDALSSLNSKQVRGDIAQTREMLRAAVNRAPHSVMRSYDELLALHQQHAEKNAAASTNVKDGAGSSSTVASGIVEIDADDVDGVVQGPDPLPASFVPPVKPSSSTPTPPPAPEVPTSSSSLPVPPPTHQETSTAHDRDEETVRIPITLADDDDDDGDDGGDAADAVGPREAPSAAPTSKPTREPSTTHRIAISGVDSDDETDETVAQSPAAAPSSSTAATSLKVSTVTAASKRIAVEKTSKATKSTTGSGKKVATSPKKSPTKASRGGAMGAYELEKALVQAQGDTSALRALLASLSPSKDASRIFQTVMEPEAMVLLLDSLWTVLSPEAAEDAATASGLTHETFWQWCWALQACSSFSLLFSLVPREAKASLQRRLQQLQTRHPWAGHSKKMATVLAKFGCTL